MKGILVSLLVVFSLALSITPFMVFGQGADDAWKSFKQSEAQSWQEYTLQAEWDKFEREQQEQWLKFKEGVERKWDTFLDSTKRTWVDYGKDLDVRSEISFDKGMIEITAIVPAQIANLMDAGSEKISEQIRKLFSTDNPAKLVVLKDQLKNRRGEIVTLHNIDQYIKEEIVPKIQIGKKAYKSKDGAERIKVKVKIYLVPNHIRIRAEKYLRPVNTQAWRFEVKPQLVLAIIHTESYFNPMAKSSCGALGLMQLIPRHGAREAYHFVYNKDRVLSAEYLYDPDNNIELGTAYIHLLKNSHFGDVKETLKNRYLTICAYNWGPTAVNKKIVNNHNISQMGDQQLYTLLRERTPQETRDYLKKVTERMKMYDNFY